MACLSNSTQFVEFYFGFAFSIIKKRKFELFFYQKPWISVGEAIKKIPYSQFPQNFLLFFSFYCAYKSPIDSCRTTSFFSLGYDSHFLFLKSKNTHSHTQILIETSGGFLDFLVTSFILFMGLSFLEGQRKKKKEENHVGFVN